MKAFFALPFIPLSLLATPAAAQLPDGGITLYGEAKEVSDYRYRGISRSDEDPALQASVTVQGDSGLYAGVWGATLAGIYAVPTGGVGDGALYVYARSGTHRRLGTSGRARSPYSFFPDR